MKDQRNDGTAMMQTSTWEALGSDLDRSYVNLKSGELLLFIKKRLIVEKCWYMTQDTDTVTNYSV